MRLAQMLVPLFAALLGTGVRMPAHNVPSQQVHRVTVIATDSVQRSSIIALSQDLQALMREEDSYYLDHHRFTAAWRELPGFRMKSRGRISITAGQTWLTLHGEVTRVVVHDLTAWRPDAQQVASGILTGQ